MLAGLLAASPKAFRRPGIAERCEIIAGDFFESVPASGDAYILSRVIHDWEDAAALKILGIEIVSAFVLDKSLPEASFTVASAAFIWIGVWGELFFAKKAKEAGDRIVAEANARAAEANKVAEEERLARVRLEAQLQPRTLSQEAGARR